jgi:tetratricopeptide (TPR) repeat protein
MGWSWKVLSVDERQALCDLSAFQTPFVRAAALGVIDRPEGLAILDRLTELAWVRWDGTLGRLLVPLREYVLEMASPTAPGEWGTDARDRHAVVMAGENVRDLGFKALPDIVTAIDHALARARPDVAARLFVRARSWFGDRHSVNDGLRLGERVLQVLPRDAPERPHLAFGVASLRVVVAHPDALASMTEARAAAETSGDRQLVAQCLTGLGYILEQEGDTIRSRRFLEEAIEIFREENDLGNLSLSLGYLLKHSADLGIERALVLAEEGVDAANRSGSEVLLSYARQARVNVRSGVEDDLRVVERELADLARMARLAGQVRREIQILAPLAECRLDRGSLDAATRTVVRAQRLASELRLPVNLCHLENIQAGIERARGEGEVALRTLARLGARTDGLVRKNWADVQLQSAAILSDLGRITEAREALLTLQDPALQLPSTDRLVRDALAAELASAGGSRVVDLDDLERRAEAVLGRRNLVEAFVRVAYVALRAGDAERARRLLLRARAELQGRHLLPHAPSVVSVDRLAAALESARS